MACKQALRCVAGAAIVTTILVASSTPVLSDPLGGQRITPDLTLPPDQRSRVTNGPNFQIEGGARRGPNLFHSFNEFSIPTGGSAFFNNSPQIETIIGRVTGGFQSHIDGLIQANGEANLFLLNPNGMVFGPNARLDIGGSFIATSADAIQFGNRGDFSAFTGNVPAATLTIDPTAFIFSQIVSASDRAITSRAIARNPDPALNLIDDGLIVPTGESLILLGGDVVLDNTYLQASQGRVELGGLAAPGIVGLSQPRDGEWRLTYPSFDVARADVTLLNRSLVDVSGANRGDILVGANDITLADSSGLCAGIGAPQGCVTAAVNRPIGTLNSRAGNIALGATGTVRLVNGGQIANQLNGQATGNQENIFSAVRRALRDPNAETPLFGSVIVAAETIEISGAGSRITTSTFGTGNAGLVLLLATDSVSLEGVQPAEGEGIASQILSSVGSTANGDAGGIFVGTRSLTLSNFAGMISSVSGRGLAGAVLIQADDRSTSAINDGSVLLTDGSTIFSTVESGGVNPLGSRSLISIATGSLTLSNGAQLQTLVRGEITDPDTGEVFPAGQGDAGRIVINASEFVSVAGASAEGRSSLISAETGVGTTGTAGTVEINTNILTVTDGGVIRTSTAGSGNAGVVLINALDSVQVSGVGSNGEDSQIEASAGFTASGDAGGVGITTGLLRVDDNGRIFTSTRGQGNSAGAVALTVNRLEVVNGFIQGNVEAGADQATGGAIFVIADEILLSEGGQIQTIVRRAQNDQPAGNGQAGLVSIEAGTLQIDGFGTNPDGTPYSSGIFSRLDFGATGSGGGIALSLRGDLTLSNTAQIDTGTFGVGPAGAIAITTPGSVFLNGNSSINSVSSLDAIGAAGGIAIAAGSFLGVFDDSSITVSAAGSNNPAGNIVIATGGPLILLRNGARIDATTTSGDGGNLFFSTPLALFLVEGSRISTSAGVNEVGGGGDGGNIELGVGRAVFGIPGSDSNITAQAFDGNGGSITVPGLINLLDIAVREDDFLISNDITASSRFGADGLVAVNELDVDPVRGLVELPESLVDASRLVAQGCPQPGETTAGELGEFYVIGRGGIPQAPDEPRTSDAVIVDWVDLDEEEGHSTAIAPTSATESDLPDPPQAIEFQDWVVDASGEVLLIAQAPTPVASPSSPPLCQ